MNTEDVIRQLEQSPREIRVLCPHGHFIANITLFVRDGQMTTRWGLSGKDMRRRDSQRGGVFSADVHVSANTNTVLECVNGRCNYRGSYNERRLALELAREAVAGRAEHRLAS